MSHSHPRVAEAMAVTYAARTSLDDLSAGKGAGSADRSGVLWLITSDFAETFRLIIGAYRSRAVNTQTKPPSLINRARK
jgi:hypothetical protein